MTEIFAIMYMLFFLVTVIRELAFIRKKYDILMISGIRLMYALIYGFVPFTLMTMYNSGANVGNYVKFDSFNTLLTMFVFSVIGYVLIDFGYLVKIKKKSKWKPIDSSSVSMVGECDRLLILGIILTVVSAISLYLWSRAYGGPYKMMAYASLIRSGYDTTENSLAFFKNPANLCTMGSYVSFICLIQKPPRHKIINLLMLTINVYCKVLYSLIDDGRMNTVIYFVGFIAILYYDKLINRKITLRKVAGKALIVIALSFFFMVFASVIMDNIRYSDTTKAVENFDFFTSIVSEFRYTFSNLYTSINSRWDGFEYTFFRNLLSGLFAYFPTRLKPEYARINLTKINSINVYGEVYARHSGSPPDFLSVALYDIGFIGIILYPIVLGILLRIMDDKLTDYKNGTLFGRVVYLCLWFRVARIIANAAMYNVLLSVFYIVVSVIMFYLINRTSLGRYQV